MVAEAEQRLGGIDVLVSSVAAAVVPQLLHGGPVGEIEAVLHDQLLPPLLLTRLVLPGMYERGGGSVVLIASDAAKVAAPGETVIGAAMAAGIAMFARTAALESKRRGVRVNALTPSLVTGTPTTDHVTAEGFSAKLFAAAARQAHLGVAEPEDVAALAVYLAGPAARRVIGQVINVDEGSRRHARDDRRIVRQASRGAVRRGGGLVRGRTRGGDVPGADGRRRRPGRPPAGGSDAARWPLNPEGASLF